MNAQNLKNSILQLAIQGKLVEQLAGEGTANDVYDQIQSKKAILMTGGAIKKEKSLPEITKDEIPFDIPKSWKWVRLSEVIDVRDGTHDSPKYVLDGIPLVTSKNLSDGKIDFSNVKLISQEDSEMINKRSGVEDGDILFAMIGTIGNPVLVKKDREFSIKNMALFKPLSEKIDMIYLLKFLELEQHSMKKKATGAVQSFVSLKVLRSTLFPLPPFEEQKRIVEKIEELIPYVEKYGETYENLELLNKNFPEDMKKSILEYAIRGKLVEQHIEEGLASNLYEQLQKEKSTLIAAGKSKKVKPLPEISEKDIPFEVPSSWKWVRLGDICTTVTKGTTPKGGKNAYLETGVAFIRAENVSGFDKIDLSNLKYIDKCTHTTSLARSILKENDILITIAGTLGRTAIVRGSNLPLNCNQAVSIARLINYDIVDLKFLTYALNAPTIQSNLISMKKITAIPNLTLEIISNCLLPIPPLEEQKRVVEKIEELMTYVK